MSDEKRAFTVSDRRHFTRSGDPRPESEPGAGGTSEPSLQENVGSETNRSVGDPDAVPPVTLESFVVSIAAQAGAVLQGVPAEGDRPAIPPDLHAARQMISILEMLLEKTEARRTEEETRLLEGVLFELRMAFVESSRRVGR